MPKKYGIKSTDEPFTMVCKLASVVESIEEENKKLKLEINKLKKGTRNG